MSVQPAQAKDASKQLLKLMAGMGLIVAVQPLVSERRFAAITGDTIGCILLLVIWTLIAVISVPMLEVLAPTGRRCS